MKWLSRLLFRGLALILSIPILLLILLSLPPINARLIELVADLTDGLSINKVNGTLMDRLSLQGINYETESLQLSINKLEIELEIEYLLQGLLSVKEVSIEQPVYRQLSHQQQPETETGPIDIPLNIRLKQAVISDLNYQDEQQQISIQQIKTALALEQERINIQYLTVKYQEYNADLKGFAELNQPNQLQLSLELQGQLDQVGQLNSHWDIQGNRQKLTVRQTLSTPFALEFTGSVQAENNLTLQIQGQWHSLQWPLQGEALVNSDQGVFTVAGNLDGYQIQLDSDLQGKDLPASELSITALADRQSLQLSKLHIFSNPGQMNAKGRLGWSDGLNWDVDINLDSMPLQHWQTAIQGEISAVAELQGSQRESMAIDVNLKSLQGQLESYPINGSGRILYHNNGVKVEQFELTAGDNVFSANGSIGSDNQLVIDIDANNLAEIDPDWSGKIKANANVTGSQHAPNAQLALTIDNLSFQNLAVEHTTLEGRYQSAQHHPWQLSTSSSQLRIADQIIDTLALQSSGDLIKHTLALDLSSSLGDIDFKVVGGYQTTRQRWAGQLQTLQLKETPFGNWINEHQTQVDLALQDKGFKVNTENFCLVQQGSTAKLCLNALATNKGKQSWQLNADQLRLSDFNDMVPETLKLEGRLNAEFKLTDDQGIKGSFNAQSVTGKIRYQSQLTGDQALSFETAITGNMDNEQFNANYKVEAQNKLNLNGQVSVDSWRDSEASMLNGNLQLSIPDLAILNHLELPVSGFEGSMETHMTAAGSLEKPYLASLSGSIDNAAFTMQDWGTAVSEFNFKAEQLGSENFQLQGQGRIGDELLRLDGNIVAESDTNSVLKLKINGNHLKLVQLPEAEIWMSPDLSISLANNSLDISGQLTVPEANLTFLELPPSAVSVSQDEVLIPEQTEQNKEMNNLTMDVLVRLGEAVKIEGFGLSTRLQGDLKAIYNNGRLQLFNELNLVDGMYQSYGQDLTIEKGQILFSGSINNPGVNVLAFRKAIAADDNVIAYLRMTGFLKSPNTSIYTVPSLPQNEALSYLLTGGPLDGAGGSSAALLAKAAMYYGKDYIGGLAGAVGIDEFDFKSTSVGEASLILGKQVLPDLYVRYIMDVITTQMVVAVEYHLTEQISIEARAGETHSSDIKYRFEFDDLF